MRSKNLEFPTRRPIHPAITYAGPDRTPSQYASPLRTPAATTRTTNIQKQARCTSTYCTLSTYPPPCRTPRTPRRGPGRASPLMPPRAIVIAGGIFLPHTTMPRLAATAPSPAFPLATLPPLPVCVRLVVPSPRWPCLPAKRRVIVRIKPECYPLRARLAARPALAPPRGVTYR